jgi:acyl-coenzyme A thioesterase 13
MRAPPGYEPLTGRGDFMDLVGPVHARGAGEERVLGLRIEERHRNAAGAAQGGLLATLCDFALGRAVSEGGDHDGVVTVSLTVDYLGPAKPGDWVEAHTKVERLGGTLAFADCSLRVDEREVVRARAVFALG